MNRYSEMDDRTLVDLTLLGNDDAVVIIDQASHRDSSVPDIAQ